jgi:hypothetical protein
MTCSKAKSPEARRSLSGLVALSSRTLAGHLVVSQ